MSIAEVVTSAIALLAVLSVPTSLVTALVVLVGALHYRSEGQRAKRGNWQARQLRANVQAMLRPKEAHPAPKVTA